MTREQLHSLMDKAFIKWMPTGSRYICNQPPMDTDEDYIALVGDGAEGVLTLAGFAMNTDPNKYDEMPEFLAFRSGEFNVVTTQNVEFYARFCAATEEAKGRNLLAKADRIALFQRVLYGVPEMIGGDIF